MNLGKELSNINPSDTGLQDAGGILITASSKPVSVARYYTDGCGCRAHC